MKKMTRGKFNIALIQLLVTPNKSTNLSRARELVLQAAAKKADVVVLPECFNSPYGTKYFPEYAESLTTGESTQALSSLAKEAQVTLIGGSIPEKCDKTSQLFNTCTIWSPNGGLLGVHRKIHLFDIDIPGKITFKESEILSPGNSLTHISTNFISKSTQTSIELIFGVGICYDIRFPELTTLAARKFKADMMIFPGAFNMTTGPLHWELLGRSRAVDNQIFVGMCSPARDMSAGYHAYGHSLISDPMGVVQGRLDETEGVLITEVDLDAVDEARRGIPVSFQRRLDLYDTIHVV